MSRGSRRRGRSDLRPNPATTALAARLLELAAREQVPEAFSPGPSTDDWVRLVAALLGAWSTLATLRPEECATVAATLHLVAMGQELAGGGD